MAILAQTTLTGGSTVSLSGGTTAPGRDFLSTTRSITQDGSFTEVDIVIDNTADLRLTVKVFRPNGANYDFVGQSQEFSSLLTGANNLVFNTPIDVLTGDLICFHVDESTEAQFLPVVEELGGTTVWDTSDHTSNVAQSAFDGTLPSNRELMFIAYDNPPAVDTISTDDDDTQKVWQRTQSDNASVTITGTYTGSPTSIERSVDGGAYSVAVASPSGGAFSDTFTLATGEHDITYRFSNDTGVTTTLTPVVVGEIFACAGQSNMSGRGTSNQTFSNSAGGVTAYLYGNNDAFGVLSDPYDSDTGQVDSVSADGNAGGSWIVRFANQWLANNEVPPIFIPCASGGTTIGSWARDLAATTLYGSMKRRVEAVGGCKVVMWEQGEADSGDATNTSGAVYQSALEQLATDINSDFGVDMFVIPLHTITAAGYNNQTTIRQAQIDAAAASANIRIGQALTDIDLSGGDGLHFQESGDLDTVATRMYADYASTPTQAPTANAGADQSVSASAVVTLDGTGSSDPDGTVASYAWAQTAGDTVTLSDPTAAQPTFTAPSTGTQQTLTFSLVVNDNDGLSSAADTVDIVVAAAGSYPFFVKDETNFNYIDDDGIWANKMRVGEIDSYTLTINQDWIDPETLVSFSVTAGDKLEILDSELQGNVIRIYVTASDYGRESVRFDFETGSRSDHVFVYADILR